MSNPPTNNNRTYFRLPYPERMMPTLTIGNRRYRVTEISEAGLRLRCKRLNEFSLGTLVEGTITFVEGDEIQFSGEFLRRRDNEYVISPLNGISYQRIVAEQRMILSRYLSLRSC